MKQLKGITARLAICLILVTLCASACVSESNRFVILSDLHISGGHDRANVPEQMEKVAEEVLEIKPAFVIILGDVGNESMANTTLSCDSICEMKLIDKAFRKWLDAGIKIHVAVGNHDVPRNKPGVAAMKRNWFAWQLPPYPMNDQLDAEKNPEIWKRYCLDAQHYYSFTWRGIHFVAMDTNDIVRLEDGGWDIAPQQREWLVNELCKHEGNPSKYPSLIFVHHPEWMTGDRGCTPRPIYHVLKENPDGHTAKAVFGGHYHGGAYWPPEDNLGVHAYATPPTVHPFCYTEYIVATVSGDSISFEKKPVAPAEDGRVGNHVEYQPIRGDFRNKE